MDYTDILDRIKNISDNWGGMEDGLEELIRRYDIIEKQKEDARNGEFSTPDGFVLVDKYDLDEVMEMAWGHCKNCGLRDCSKTKKECFMNNMLCGLWEVYCKAFGMEEET